MNNGPSREVVVTRGVANLGGPDPPAEPTVDDGAQIVGERVRVRVGHRGVRLAADVHCACLEESAGTPLLVHFVECLPVELAKDVVHFGTREAGGKRRVVGEEPASLRPASRVRFPRVSVALVEFEPSNAGVDERLCVVCHKNPSRRVQRKVGREAAEGEPVRDAVGVEERLKERRRRVHPRARRVRDVGVLP
jgi:hypothetical protein